MKNSGDLKFMWLNLNQFMIYQTTPMEDLVNQVIAIGSTHKAVVFVRPEYGKDIFPEIRELLVTRGTTRKTDFDIKLGDGFTVDTWDNKIQNFNK